MDNETEMYCFETANFVVRAVIIPDDDFDAADFDDNGVTAEHLASGAWQVFGTRVIVGIKNGPKLGESSLWGSVYADPREFFTAHRAADPMNRNCSLMRAAKGERISICHYFPDLVREAINEARNAIAAMPKLRNDNVKRVLAEVSAYDAKLDGTAPRYEDARAPTGDDYNEILSIVRQLDK